MFIEPWPTITDIFKAFVAHNVDSLNDAYYALLHDKNNEPGKFERSLTII